MEPVSPLGEGHPDSLSVEQHVQQNDRTLKGTSANQHRALLEATYTNNPKTPNI